MSNRMNTLLKALAVVGFASYVLSATPQLTGPLDLTWAFENNSIYWVGVRPFEFTKKIAGIIEGPNFWLAMNEFCAGEHGGTHIDAPYHFNKNGMKVGQLPIDKLIVPGAVIDISEEVEKFGPSTTLQVHHLTKWEEENGPFEKDSVILVNFGYSKHYSDRKKYLGLNDDETKLDFPGISGEAAQWIADSNKIVGVGVDTASIDAGVVKTGTAHQILTGKEIYLLESVKMTVPLPVRNFTLLVMPMNIAEGTGAPLRLVAIPQGYKQMIS